MHNGGVGCATPCARLSCWDADCTPPLHSTRDVQCEPSKQASNQRASQCARQATQFHNQTSLRQHALVAFCGATSSKLQHAHMSTEMQHSTMATHTHAHIRTCCAAKNNSPVAPTPPCHTHICTHMHTCGTRTLCVFLRVYKQPDDTAKRHAALSTTTTQCNATTTPATVPRHP